MARSGSSRLEDDATVPGLAAGEQGLELFTGQSAGLPEAVTWWDIALRDFGLLLGALSLAILSRKWGAFGLR